MLVLIVGGGYVAMKIFNHQKTKLFWKYFTKTSNIEEITRDISLKSLMKSDNNYGILRNKGSENCIFYDDDQVLQRCTVFSRFAFKSFRPGLDLRMEGDGAECVDFHEDADFDETFRDTPIMMEDIIKDATEIRRLIRKSLSDGDFEEDTKYEENVIEAETDWMNISSDSKKLYKIIDIDSSSETESLEWDECGIYDASFNVSR